MRLSLPLQSPSAPSRLCATLGLAVLVAACQSGSAQRQAAPSATSTVALPGATEPPTPAPAPVAPPNPPSKIEGVEAAPVKAPVTAALRRARALQASGKDDLAYHAFTEAIRAKPNDDTPDLRVLAELAFLLMTKDVSSRHPDEDPENELLSAASSDDPELQGQAWYNLALIYQSRGNLEAERAALARSLRFRDNAVVSQQLGARSRCLAEFSSRNLVEQPAIVEGWRAVCQRIGQCSDGESVTAELARRRVCLAARPGIDPAEASAACGGEGPLSVQHDVETSSFASSTTWIRGLGGNKFFVETGRDRNWPATCDGASSARWKEAGRYMTSKNVVSPYTLPIPSIGGPFSDPPGMCMNPVMREVHALWEKNSGKLLAAVEVLGHPDKIQLTLKPEAKRWNISGGGCHGYVPLDASMRYVEIDN